MKIRDACICEELRAGWYQRYLLGVAVRRWINQRRLQQRRLLKPPSAAHNYIVRAREASKKPRARPPESVFSDRL